MVNNNITVYTDGSCDPSLNIGAWAAIIIIHDSNQHIVLQGCEPGVTHQQMELMAVTKSLEYISNNMAHCAIEVCSDSQYVMGIQIRKDVLKLSGFLTKKGHPIRNTSLVQRLIGLMEPLTIKFVKVKAHQKGISDRNFNREVDILCRKIVRKHRK